MRLLFVKPSLAWPRSTGHDVYCYHMMKALAGAGAEVSLATLEATSQQAIEGVPLVFLRQLGDGFGSGGTPPVRLTQLQERFRSFWGIDIGHIEAVRRIAAGWDADVVIAFGLPSLPYLAGAGTALRVWAMADEWIYHHLSQVRLTDTTSWRHVREALIKGSYERAYRSLVDRVWVVSETDRRAARWFAGMPVSDLLPNGVDTDFFQPTGDAVSPASAVFWGRFDFEPNVDAVQWFCTRVFPQVLRSTPNAHFTIMGYAATPEIERLAQLPGISFLPNVADLRGVVCRHAVVVLPFLSGGGIKNKLLEAAALGRAIVCSPHVCRDLRFDGALPLVQATTPGEWVESLTALWRDDARRAELGRDARSWVSRYYSWSAPARDALEGFRQGLAARKRS